MSLVDLMYSAKDYRVSDDAGPWRQYVLDHIDYFIKNSPTYTIDPKLMWKYKHDLDGLLLDYYSLMGDLGWIVLLMNNIYSDFDLDASIASLVIPSDSFISNQYLRFVTTSGVS